MFTLGDETQQMRPSRLVCSSIPRMFHNPNFPALFSRNKLPSRIYRRTI